MTKHLFVINYTNAEGVKKKIYFKTLKRAKEFYDANATIYKCEKIKTVKST